MQHHEPLLPHRKNTNHSWPFVILLTFLFAVGVLHNFAQNNSQVSHLQDESSGLGVAVGVNTPKQGGKAPLLEGSQPVPSEGGPSTSGALPLPPLASGSPQAMPPGYSSVPQGDPDALGGVHVSCNHETKGYEVTQGLCNRNPSHKVFLSAMARVPVPKGLNLKAYCKGQMCTAKDEPTCCGRRPQCLSYIEHVQEGCPTGTRPNPIEYALCTTNPCTINDEGMCCVAVEPSRGQLTFRSPAFHALFYNGIYERVDGSRSKPAKVAPSDDAKDIEPKITFGSGTFGWFDMSASQKVGDDTWAPLVNFMQFWREDLGWPTQAWMKVQKGPDLKWRQMITDLDGGPMSWIKLAKQEKKK